MQDISEKYSRYGFLVLSLLAAIYVISLWIGRLSETESEEGIQSYIAKVAILSSNLSPELEVSERYLDVTEQIVIISEQNQIKRGIKRYLQPDYHNFFLLKDNKEYEIGEIENIDGYQVVPLGKLTDPLLPRLSVFTFQYRSKSQKLGIDYRKELLKFPVYLKDPIKEFSISFELPREARLAKGRVLFNGKEDGAEEITIIRGSESLVGQFFKPKIPPETTLTFEVEYSWD